MVVQASTRTVRALTAAAAILVASGCGTGVVERLLPAAAPSGSATDLTVKAEEGSGNSSLLPAGGGASTDTSSPPRPVGIYLIGPRRYLATNLPIPPDHRPSDNRKRPSQPRAQRAPQGQDPAPESAKLEEAPHGG